MTLPSTPPLSMSDIAAELGVSPVGLSLGDTIVRNLAGIPSGPISFSDLLGKSHLTVDVTPATDSETGTATSRTFSPNATANVTGSGSYSYIWTFEDNVNGTWSFGDDDAASTSVTVSNCDDVDTSYSATIRCTVTDLVTGAVKSDTANRSYFRSS